MILQEDKGMRFGTINAREESNGKRGKENSVGIIWQAIRAKGGNQILLLWNAYLYHPFEKSGTDSNRKPNAAKLQVRRSTWRNCSVFLEFLKIVFMQWEEQQKNRWDI